MGKCGRSVRKASWPVRPPCRTGRFREPTGSALRAARGVMLGDQDRERQGIGRLGQPLRHEATTSVLQGCGGRLS